jgi:hypothetical protein
MDVAATSTALASANLKHTVALKVLKSALDMQEQLVTQLLPQTTPTVDPSSPLGQNIDIRV